MIAMANNAQSPNADFADFLTKPTACRETSG